MWIIKSNKQRWACEDGQIERAGKVVELFLDFDPVCPGWPPEDTRDLTSQSPAEEEDDDDCREDWAIQGSNL